MGVSSFVTVDGVHRGIKKLLITDEFKKYRFVKEVFVTEGGVYKKLRGLPEINYTGNMTEQIVAMSGQLYRLLTLTSSGTLTVPEEMEAEVWMCGGGMAGGAGSTSYGSSGPGIGGVGGFTTQEKVTLTGSIVAVIGAGGSKTTSSSYYSYGSPSSFGELSTKTQYKENSIVYGGTGSGPSDKSEGDGITKYPFGESSLFKCHCAGGGQGGRASLDYYGYSEAYYRPGADGGEDGGDGGPQKTQVKYSGYPVEGSGGLGGVYGGGKGGYGYAGTTYSYDSSTGSYSMSASASCGTPYSATFYGSGGGGGGYAYSYYYDPRYNSNSTSSKDTGDGAEGYQGVIYVRIPIK